MSSAATASVTASATASASISAEWVEIIEPRTQEHMFANLTTGECVWDPPVGVPVKKTNDNQWWELFDQNTARFYYYNATSQKTVWHRPANCDIIPLAKLQTLKQNTEVRDVVEAGKCPSDVKGSSESTQTPSSPLDRLPSNGLFQRTKLTPSQTSPVDSPKALRRPRHHSRHHSDIAGLRGVQPPPDRSPSSDEFKFSRPPSKATVTTAGSASSRRGQDTAVYASPQKTTSQRFLYQEQQRSADDKRRTTIGPAQAKYYSIPHRVVDHPPSSSASSTSKYSVPSSTRHPSANNGTNDSSFANSISRSVSFMSRQPTRGASEEQHYTSGWRSSFDSSGGRRSVESTPQSNRRLKESPESNHSGSVYANSQSSKNSDIGSPIEGFCTPMINRKQRQEGSGSGAVWRTSSKKSGDSQTSPSPLKEQLSITQLVNSGLSTLTDGNHPAHCSSNGGRQSHTSSSTAQQQYRPHKMRRSRDNSSTLERASLANSKMSPLQQYILEQAKLSGYRFGDPVTDGDRDSYVESEEDWADRHDESDDFADDEDGGGSDELSKASSVDGEDDRYLSEPTYNNLDPGWLQSVHGYQTPMTVQQYKHPTRPPEATQPPTVPDIDAFSEEFDIRMRFSHRGGGHGPSSSTMPRPASHQPTSSLLQQQQQQHLQNPAFPVPYDILHPSLQRNTHSLIDPAMSSTLNRGAGIVGRSLSRAVSERPHDHGGSTLSVSASMHSAISCESDIEKYAMDNLNVQKKGLFRKKMTVKDILTHTKESIRKPLTCLRDKSAKKESIEVFRLVQIYMGDRRAKQGMTINSVALDITVKGFTMSALRDEIYVQLCKQTTENLNSRESLRRGWELLAICLGFFPPSATFAPALYSYIQKHRDPAFDYPDVGKWPIHVQISHYAGICAKRLDRIGDGGRLVPKKPSVDEIDQSRLQIFRPSMFGGTLHEAMEIQRDRFPQRKLPWILTTLAEQIMQLNGPGTEGIFRVPADLDEVNSVKGRFDQWEIPACADCHTAASLLKLWFRELYEPLIPDNLYEDCVQIADDASRLPEVVDRMPELNRDVMMFLMHFLQFFARPEVAGVTKMDASNLGTVFAPNCLRCQSKEPSVILDNTRKEMAFVKNLIFHLDTSSVEGIL